jgi:condensin complex subunit 1
MSCKLLHASCNPSCSLVRISWQAAAVIGDIAAVDARDYELQQNATGEKAGVRSIAAFVEELADRMPRFMAGQVGIGVEGVPCPHAPMAELAPYNLHLLVMLQLPQISLLIPYLGGKAWSLRSSIIIAVAYLLHKAYDNSMSDAADKQGGHPRSKSVDPLQALPASI